MPEQKRLYLYNRAQLGEPGGGDPALLAFERQWIAGQLAEIPPADCPGDLASLQQSLARLIEEEQRELPASARYVGERMSLEEFRILVQEFAVDGLTEAQVFYYILPRLTLEAQMPMLRIMIDESGSRRELQMPTALAFYSERLEPESFAFVNLFFWLTLRADDPSYFAGAITYLETAIPAFFECYVQACQRLGIEAHAYYSEHQHIDAFHALEGQRLLRAMQATASLCPRKAWLGARLASAITAAAFEGAVGKARRLQSLPFPPPLDALGRAQTRAQQGSYYQVTAPQEKGAAC